MTGDALRIERHEIQGLQRQLTRAVRTNRLDEAARVRALMDEARTRITELEAAEAPPEPERPAYWDGRYGTTRTLAQRLATASSSLALEKSELKRLGQAIIRAELANKMDKARTLRDLVPERRENIRRHEEKLAKLQAIAAGEIPDDEE